MERAFPGRCWRVLAGGLPAGHLGGVLCAAWHPRLPVVATCGVSFESPALFDSFFFLLLG